MNIADRLNTWWRTRQRIRAWRKIPPERKLAIIVDCIDQTPSLRDGFRKALRLDGRDRMVGEKRR